MKKRDKKITRTVSMCVLLIFLFSVFSSELSEFFSEASTQKMEREIQNLPQRQQFVKASSHLQISDYLHIGKKNSSAFQNVKLIRHLREVSRIWMTAVFLESLFLMSAALFLQGRGRLFACFRACSFYLAQFLCKLVIQQREDGKKWSAVQ